MKSVLTRIYIVALAMSLVILFGVGRSFADPSDGDDNFSGIVDRENKTEEAIDKIQQLQEKAGNDSNQDEALLQAASQIDAQTAAADADATGNTTTQKVPVKSSTEQTTTVTVGQVVPAQQVISVQQVVPVQQVVSAPQVIPVKQVTPAQQVIPVKPVAPVPVGISNKVNTFEFGTESSYIEYKEPGLMREKGPYFGLYAGYYSRPKEYQDYPINVLHLDTHVDFGVVNYKGTGEVNNIHDYMVEPRAWVGKDLHLGSSVQVTPYAGIGYRFLFDSLSKDSSGGGYDRRSQYLYVPLGVETKVQLPHHWQIGVNGEYDILIRGWQTSYLSNIDAVHTLPDLNNTQHNGYGLRGSIDFIKEGEKFTFILSPYIRYWNVKRSALGIALNDYYEVIGDEPDNNSTEIGLKFTVEF